MVTNAVITISGLTALAFAAVAAPTERRTWTSAQGSTLSAVAHGIDSGDVIFECASGKLARVPLEKLSDADQNFLDTHFNANEQPAERASDEEDPKPASGTIVEDIAAGEDASLVAYIPASAPPGSKLPAICYIDQRRGQAKSLKRLAAGSEVTGWPIVMSTVVKGNLMKNAAPPLAEGWMEAMERELPIDCARLFGACYGSGAEALMLMHKKMDRFDGVISFCGALNGGGGSVPVSYCVVGINTPARKTVSEGFDKKAPKGSVLRLTDNGRKNGTADDYEDAMVFLAAHYYSNDGTSHTTEGAGFIDRALDRIEVFGDEQSERAALWLHWLNSVRMPPELRDRYDSITSQYDDDDAQLFVQGLALMQRFAVNDLADAGPSTDEESRTKLQKKVDRLTEKLEGTGWVEVLNAFE